MKIIGLAVCQKEAPKKLALRGRAGQRRLIPNEESQKTQSPKAAEMTAVVADAEHWTNCSRMKRVDNSISKGSEASNCSTRGQTETGLSGGLAVPE